MFTTPGRKADVCGVKEILSSFLSYAGYAVSRGAAGCACGGGVWVWGNENAEEFMRSATGACVGAGAATGAAGAGESKRPRISLTVLFCAGADAPPGAEGAELPNI